ncbi:MAG: metalloregulator ArsR/SmtB family transcription factor [Sulfurospirillaceae bacterium]|nr:metalloregulator ArsR/SmtB family transcription factor [Sulfurospirillaceae bacterium]
MKDSQELIRSCCEGISHIPEIKKILPNDEELKSMTCIFKALNDPMRVKILFALLKYEICVGELVNLLQIPQSHVSHQLRILRKYDIVTYQKDKKMSFYRIKNEHVKELLTTALKSLKCQKKK